MKMKSKEPEIHLCCICNKEIYGTEGHSKSRRGTILYWHNKCWESQLKKNK